MITHLKASALTFKKKIMIFWLYYTYIFQTTLFHMDRICLTCFPVLLAISVSHGLVTHMDLLFWKLQVKERNYAILLVLQKTQEGANYSTGSGLLQARVRIGLDP